MIVVMPYLQAVFFSSRNGAAPPVEGFLGRDLPAYIDANYRTVDDRHARAIAGISMGGYGATLLKLRLPMALPFIFNALKINSTLALIGAIVAEFFGTPIVGMGFRISTEVGRMNLDMVWAEIALAAIAGSTFYGLVALIERGVTFWHPSYRT